MKKIIAFLLTFTIVIICISVSFAENENIVGTWYANIESDTFPDKEAIGDITRAIMIATFIESGEIVFLEIDYKGTKAEITDSGVIGKWEKVENDYYASIIAIGKDKVIFKDDMMYVSIFNKETYVGLRKMDTFDFYYNILIK